MILTTLPNIKTYTNEFTKLQDSIVIFAKTSERYFYPEHKTPFLFVTNFLNKGEYRANKKHINISDKVFYFLNANDTLEINFSKVLPLQTLFILFEDKFFKGCVNYYEKSDSELLDLPNPELDSWFKLPIVPFEFNEIIHRITLQLLQKSMPKECFDTLLFELITEFLSINDDTSNKINKIKSVKKSTKEELYRRLFIAKELMNENISSHLSIEQISKEVCLNKFHFLSNFKSLFNTTPHQYFIELKLQKAFHLLQSRKYSVTEVCHLVGYESLGSFSNSFKKRFKILPSAFSEK